MAIIHQATIVPTKPELLAAWLPTQPWWPGGDIEQIGSYRFDDPDGEVGLETMLLRTASGVVQVPVTYRGAPLPDVPDSEAALVGTMEHSVLGPRWVYDAPADPVYRAVLRATILTGGHGAIYEIHHDDGTVTTRPATVAVTGHPGDHSGEHVVVERRPGAGSTGDEPVLAGTWDGQSEPVVLARLD